MLKFKLGQTVFYMVDNRVHGAPILSRKYVDNKVEPRIANQEQEELFTPFGKAGAYYNTCHGLFSESVIFASKEDLVADILSNAV